MKILFFTQAALTSKQVGFCTEVLDRLNEEGHDIRVIRCNAAMSNCYFNRSHNILACASCQSRESRLIKITNIHKSQCHYIHDDFKVPPTVFPAFDSLDELKEYNYEGVNIGRGAASSIISHTRDFEINSGRYDYIIRNELTKAATLTRLFKYHLESWSPDEIYLFNGRFAEVYPLVDLAIQNNITYHCIEAGAGDRNYNIFSNTLPHSIIGRTHIINDIWNNADPKTRDQQAKTYFESKVKGDESYEKSYTKDQDPNKLPSGFDTKKTNIVIYNSSEDEVKTIDEWQQNIYDTQNEAISKICAVLESHDDIQIYLRVHPNLYLVDNLQTQEISRMSFKNLIVIPSGSDISSYALMFAADKIITFGSTIGIEATYFSKVSIMLGKSYYMHTGACYLPHNISECIDLLLDSDLLPKESQTTYPYGLFLMEYGYKATYFNYNKNGQSTYKGYKLRAFYPSTLIYLIKYIPYFHHWKKLHKYYYGSFSILKSLFQYR